MKTSAKFLLCSFAAVALPTASLFADPDNPNIDMPGYLKVANEAAAQRQTHRVSEDDFIRMSREPGTIILDARSREKYDLLHISGAINLSFPDIDIESLKKTLPDKNARILIYCNNNFSGDQNAFPSKRAPASLNISTYIALYGYGYRNVYELAPYVDVHKTKLPLVTAPVSLRTLPVASPQTSLAWRPKIFREPVTLFPSSPAPVTFGLTKESPAASPAANSP